MHYRLEPGNDRHILRVNDDGTEEPFAVVFDPTAGAFVVDALNASLDATPRSVRQVVKGSVTGPVIQIGHVSGSVRS